MVPKRTKGGSTAAPWTTELPMPVAIDDGDAGCQHTRPTIEHRHHTAWNSTNHGPDGAVMLVQYEPTATKGDLAATTAASEAVAAARPPLLPQDDKRAARGRYPRAGGARLGSATFL